MGHARTAARAPSPGLDEAGAEYPQPARAGVGPRMDPGAPLSFRLVALSAVGGGRSDCDDRRRVHSSGDAVRYVPAEPAGLSAVLRLAEPDLSVSDSGRAVHAARDGTRDDVPAFRWRVPRDRDHTPRVQPHHVL